MIQKIKKFFTRSEKKNNPTTTNQDNCPDLFSCSLPSHLGIAVPAILKLFSSRIHMEDLQIEKLRTLPDDSIVVFASKYKNYTGYLYYYTKFKNSNIPRPTIGLEHNVYMWQPVSKLLRMGIYNSRYFFKHFSFPDPYQNGYVENELLNGKTAFISLVGSRGFYNWFVRRKTDPVNHLINIQKSIDRPVIIVPQLMFFNKSPLKTNPTFLDILFGNREKPGLIKKIIGLSKKNNKPFAEISEPVNLQTFLSTPEIQSLNPLQQAAQLRQHLIGTINRHRQSIIGPILKSPEELKTDILTGKKLQSFMTDYAESSKTEIHQVHKKADAYLDEIAANYNLNIIKVFSTVLTWVFKNIFDGISVDTDELDRVKECSKKAPIVLLPCHKSHLDYLLFSYILFNNNMPCPHIAAGKNLSFWPLGPIFRGGGAFFLRRTFKGALLYSKIFSSYIEKILLEGFNLEFFIEGGRSRSGKLLPPKLGLLSIVLDVFSKNEIEDLIFVPIYIGYDRVLEERSYLHELEGGKKEPENLIQIIKARKLLKKRYGKVYIKCNEPISLKDYLGENNHKKQDTAKAYHKSICQDLGYQFVHAINKVSVVTPHGVIANALLNNPKPRFTYEQLLFQIDTYMSYLVSRKVGLADTLIIDPDHTRDLVLNTFIQRKFITCNKDNEGFEDAGFSVNETKRPVLDYYKNNSVFFFAPAAFTALAIFEIDAFQFSADDLSKTYQTLRDLFHDEFSHNRNRSSNSYVRRSIKAFIDDAIIVPHPTLPDRYNLTSVGYRKLTFFANIMKPFLESYLVVSNYFDKTYSPDDDTSSKEHIKKIQALGLKMYKKSQIEKAESLSKINLNNGLNFFLTRHAVDFKTTDDDINYTKTIQKYLDILSS